MLSKYNLGCKINGGIMALDRINHVIHLDTFSGRTC